MSDHLFLFDLDSTITKQEILPTIAEEIGLGKQMRKLTEQAMYENMPFKQSFLSRVRLLEDIPVSQIDSRIAQIPVHEELVRFMRDNSQRCLIVTGNLDVWISGLMERIGMSNNVYCSKGIVRNDRLVDVVSVIDKSASVAQLTKDYVAVGDGSNDAQMISTAKVGIGFGGVRPIAPSVLEVATHAIYEEKKLCQFLERLL
jgi:HAD superfamily phosphoserine phosphatase-like hydrolase